MKYPSVRFQAVAAALACSATFSPWLANDAQAWEQKKAPLMTQWASQVDPNKPLPEYPRPQLVRSEWLNLNGLWQYQPGAAGDASPTGKTLGSEILVPFPVESALSGVMEHHERLWYRRNFTVPATWKNKQVKLHFGAVDYEAEIFVNGQSAGVHRGGYESFSLNITPFLNGDGPQELIVRVYDPTESGGQPRGKQTTRPEGIMYTPTTGIWQTVWLEPVSTASIDGLHMVPDVDNSSVKFTVDAASASSRASALIQIKDGNQVVKTVTAKPGVEVSIPVANAKLWSPDSPFLYDVDVTLRDGGQASDKVSSYFGMRKISVGPVNGVPKLLLNNKFVFQMGPLDQGFWPDGIYTAPTDDALRYDLEMTKKLGFNMTRKHIKVEPARWYYHADKLGLLVWQDMPSANSYTGNPAVLDKVAYEKQMESIITSHWNSPAIVMWVIFNESQGRHDTRYLTNRAKAIDPSRLTNRDSDAGYERDGDGDVGDVDDVHSYPPPAVSQGSPNQALACGEYGGISYVMKGHTWKGDGWGYTTVPSVRDLEDLYGEFTEMLEGFQNKNGLSAAVYTQITDVEIEVNGLLTYDRVLKVNADQIALANRFNYAVPTYQALVPTSETTPQTWKYTTTAPPANWTQPQFNDAAWETGVSGFGSSVSPNSPRIATKWESDDIWLRRTFNPGALTAEQVEQLVVRNIHDDDLEVYVNGVLALKAGGANSAYQNRAMTDEGKRALLPNATNVLAVHCKETGGDQFVDVGISLRIPGAR